MMTQTTKQMTLTISEYQILEGRRYYEGRLAGQQEAEAKLEKAFRRLWRAAKGQSMITLNDALELVNVDFISLLEWDGSIALWKGASPYVVVFKREPRK